MGISLADEASAQREIKKAEVADHGSTLYQLSCSSDGYDELITRGAKF